MVRADGRRQRRALLQLEGGASGYYVWHNAAGWHLRVKAGTGAQLTGSVAAGARVRVVRASAAARAGLKTAPRSLTFRFSGTGKAEAIDFTAACSARLAFKLGPQESAPSKSQPSGGAPSAGETAPVLPVFLGNRGQAPAVRFDLTRPIATGVAGQVLIGPTCPVATPDNPCPPKAGKGTVRIQRAASSRGGQAGEVVATLQTDASGSFTADLSPGRYLLVVVKDGPGFPVPKPSIAEVQQGVVTRVQVWLDTGIR